MTSNLRDWLCQACKANKLALIAHVNPDGDTVGAVLALRLAFLRLGKAVDVICDGIVSRGLSFLEGYDAFITPDRAARDYDTVIAVDVSDHALLGASAEVFDGAPVRMVIDHHATNPAYGAYNLIRGEECACCVLAYEAIRAMGVELTVDIGTCLMTGMSTDTGHFQYPYTTSAALHAAAELRAIGVDLSAITRRLYRTQPRNLLELTRIAYQKMRFELLGQVGIIELSVKDMEKAGCRPGQTDGIVNRALEVEGVRMAILATEREDGVKLSLRAVEPDTVNDIARQFGGGGHAQAAGCTIHLPLHEATQAVLDVMKNRLERKA